jgi:hypothetical protein
LDDIKIFLFGIIFIYVMQILDLLIQVATSYMSVILTRHQVKIQELVGEKEIPERTPAIGFVVNHNDEQYDD